MARRSREKFNSSLFLYIFPRFRAARIDLSFPVFTCIRMYVAHWRLFSIVIPWYLPFVLHSFGAQALEHGIACARTERLRLAWRILAQKRA
jgi:hypothetical protein